MTKSEQIQYARYILENNAFQEYELMGLMGQDEKYLPHALPQGIWREVFRATSKTWRKMDNGLWRLLGKDEPQRITDCILGHSSIEHLRLRRCIPW